MRWAILAVALLSQLCLTSGMKFQDGEELDLSKALCNQTVDASESSTACGNMTYIEMSQGNMIYAYSKNDERLTCTGDYVFPILASEPLWSEKVRLLFYFLLLVWCFLGVAIISDHFMAAIEVITAKEKVIVVQNENGDPEEKKILVWNETVANLSLMALGSSAPEILLSVVETLGSLNKEPEDGLGPSTIVGSAAFNLLIINAVCIIAIPDGDSRSIAEYGVFGITGFSSVWAYLWMYIVLQDSEVTITEAVITLLMFPLLVFLSYAQTKQWWGLYGKPDRKVKPEGHIIAIDGGNHGTLGDRKRISKEGSNGKLVTIEEKQKAQLATMLHHLPEDLTDEDMAKMAAQGIMAREPVSNLRYRINARRKLVGGKGVIQNKMEFVKKHTIRRFTTTPEPIDVNQQQNDVNYQATLPVVTFSSSKYSVNEDEGVIKIPIHRVGHPMALQKTSHVYFETLSGTAKADEDFIGASGELKFSPNEVLKEIEVKIVDDNTYEGDEVFYVALKHIENMTQDVAHCDLKSSPHVTCEVTIIDDDKPGQFSFEHGAVVVRESDGKASLTVKRRNGIANKIAVNYKTIDSTAKAGKDYYETTGTLIFDHGVCEASFSVVIIDGKRYDKDSTFTCQLEILDLPESGAEYGEHQICAVTITNDEQYAATVDRVAELMKIHLENVQVGTTSWLEQIQDALTVQGEDGEDPGWFDIIMHILTFGWKVLFALVPPTTYWGGWASFSMSLFFIGLLTMAVGDIAKIFGCLLGVPNPLTAITFVALGTSLPDTFASKTAAESDDTADNSIGNVTGSNSVNVFLGLGLPWCIGSIYKAAQGEPYIVPRGALSFSVIVFCSVATVFFILMWVRRKLQWGELGGPRVPKWISFWLLVFLWALYVTLSGLQSMGHI